MLINSYTSLVMESLFSLTKPLAWQSGEEEVEPTPGGYFLLCGEEACTAACSTAEVPALSREGEPPLHAHRA